jgi:ferredoxin
MPYVITQPCIRTKDHSCTEVCPVDGIHPTPDEPGYDTAEQLHIDPDECIDCDACVEACPVDAIYAEEQVPGEWQTFIQINAGYYVPRGRCVPERWSRMRPAESEYLACYGEGRAFRAARPFEDRASRCATQASRHRRAPRYPGASSSTRPTRAVAAVERSVGLDYHDQPAVGWPVTRHDHRRALDAPGILRYNCSGTVIVADRRR